MLLCAFIIFFGYHIVVDWKHVSFV